jgi:hypothetical protein
MVKSIGTTVTDIEVLQEGYVVRYGRGDQCFYEKNTKNFTSEVRFICDQEEDEGWP